MRKKTRQGRRRFIIIPKAGLTDATSTPEKTVRRLHQVQALPGAGASAAEARGHELPTSPAAHPVSPAADFTVVNSSPSDGAVLVSADDGASIGQIRALAPSGAKVFEEQWFPLVRARGPWQALHLAARRSRGARAKHAPWTVTVRLDTPEREPLKDALVTAMVDEAQGTGAAGATDRYGHVRLDLGPGVHALEALYVDPLHGAWPVRRPTVAVVPEGLEVLVPPIDLHAADARGLVYGKPHAHAGQGVKVGVIDTGVGPHADLRVAGGRNTTEESPRRWRDWDGHGTHVAGVICAVANGWRRGEAAGAELRAYRIFTEGSEEASTFAISAAIKQAAIDGCDLINLSIGGAVADGAVRDAIDQAWGLGCVCIAATGNDGRAVVAYPARYAKAIAVSAIGLRESWPAGTHFDWTLSADAGKPLGGSPSFHAKFANRGQKVALTAPGVAIVSTIFGDRWGVMSGTSMATPVATGVLTRRLAKSQALKMPRDAARSEAIAALAVADAEDLGLPPAMQGKGLAR